MTRYVSLATDAAPTYAVFLPAVARVWRDLGFEVIAHVEADPWWNETRVGRLIRRKLDPLARVIEISPAAVLAARHAQVTSARAAANTARVIRLAAAAHVAPADFVMLADADMIPISREFFGPREEEDAPICVRRWLYHAWAGGAARVPARLRPRRWQFAICYTGARAQVWRDALGLVAGDAEASLAAMLLRLPSDPPWDLDERLISACLLACSPARGYLEMIGEGRWRQGQMNLIDPSDARRYEPNIAPGLCCFGRGYDAAMPPIDLIPARAYCHSHPLGWLDVIADQFPALRAWARSYGAVIGPLLDDRALWRDRCCAGAAVADATDAAGAADAHG